jgi:hypothetical protein
MTPIERVTERVLRNGNPEDRKTPAPMLTLQEFFEGNDCVGSIGCNLDNAPAPDEFWELLSALAKRDDVSDIRIEITALDAPGEEWPFSDRIWIFTSANLDEVESWFPQHLAPDEVWVGFGPSQKYEQVDFPSGHQPIAVWYD